MDVEMMKNENVENVGDTDVSEGKAKKKGKFLAVKIGGALVLLAAVSIGLLPGLIARFSSQDETGDNGRVATFNVKEEGTWTQEIAASVSPGDIKIQYKDETTGKFIDETSNNSIIQVINNSEVAIAYSITITNETHNIKDLKIVNNNNEETDDSDTKKWEFSGELEPGENSKDKDDINLSFKWKSTPINDDVKDANLDYMGRVDYYTVTVTATQINSYTNKTASATP